METVMADPAPDHLNAIIAAGSLLCGVLISQATSMFATKLDRKHRKHERLLAKLDEMMLAMDKPRDWYYSISKSTSISHARSLPPDISRVQTLSILYFRELEQPVAAYAQSLAAYYVWVISCMSSLGPDASLPLPVDTWMRMSDQFSAQTEVHSAASMECQRRLIAAMKTTAQNLMLHS